MIRQCILAVLITGSVVVSTSVLAKNCGEESNTIAIEICHQEQYVSADKELNAVYSEAMKTLEPGAKQKLKEAQKAWLKTRDANIAFMIEQNKDSGTIGGVVVGDYKTKLVQKRVLELKYMLSSLADAPVAW